jgi:hypothetical protein
MAEVRIYQTTERTPLAILKDDVLTHVRTMFPSFRSLVENVSIYNDEKEEILFWGATGTLTYVKFIACDRDGALDYVIDDYMSVQKRWARFCAHNAQYKDRADEEIELIIVAERFKDDLVKRIKFISIAAVTLLELHTLKGLAGEIAYSLTNVYSQTGEQKVDVPHGEFERASVEELVVEEPQVKSAEELPTTEGEQREEQKKPEENITERVVVDEKPEHPAADENAVAITREEVKALQVDDVQKEHESDFFERAQLNAEEEREFFLLNQQLSESVEH